MQLNMVEIISCVNEDPGKNRQRLSIAFSLNILK
jgi:hypothetical protein